MSNALCTHLFADKLYWLADEQPPQNIHNAFFFNIDNVSISLKKHLRLSQLAPKVAAGTSSQTAKRILFADLVA